jgi:hypothetical protein
VYLIPKIFLNNKAFEEMYLTPSFQQKLILVVVDKAHMIYAKIFRNLLPAGAGLKRPEWLWILF